jgi:iron complex transport system ATP-binding protein
MTPPIIDVRAVSVEMSGRKLVDQVTMPIEQGQVLALVGPNGAGKSTLMKVIAGDLPPTHGDVLVDGKSIGDYQPRELALRRAVLPQQTFLQFSFTSREVIAMGRSARQGRGERDRDDEVVSAAMQKTETVELQQRTFPTLSGGEQARVTLARVLAQESPILLLDEPTAALDLSHQQMVMEIARDLAANGSTVVAILHDLNLAASYADKMAILHHGRLTAFAEPWDALDPVLLSEVFDCPIAVARHPVRNCPLVMPLPRNEAHRRIAGSELRIS